MSNFSQWKYVLVAYALKGTMTTTEATKYLCNTIKIKTKGSTPERSINMYVAQNTTTKSNYGCWYVRVDNGEYRLDCPQDLQSRISYVKYAKYDTNKSLVFSEHDFHNIIAEFLDKDSSLDKNKILECCQNATLVTAEEKIEAKQQHPIIQEQNDFSSRGNFDQLKYILVSYALKGEMAINDLTDYLNRTIANFNSYAEKKLSYLAQYMLYVVQNTKENKSGRHHYGNWYTKISSNKYCLDCPQDLQSRISYAKNAKYYKYKNNVFKEGEFEKIVQEFLDKDLSLDKDKIFEYCKSTTAVGTRENDWNSGDYDPGLSVEKWLELLRNPEIFNTASLEVMKRILNEEDCIATCTQLANKYGNDKNFYNKVSSALAERIVQKTGCPVQKREDGSTRWWAVLYLGKSASKEDAGTYLWKLRPELAEALKQVDLSSVKLYIDMQTDEKPVIESYSQGNFLSDVFMTSDKYNSLVRMLKAKKNIILQGAPGVGKTFAARRLAYSIMGVKDDSRIEFVQFHQNYSYEDFVMGYKPNENGFELKNGIFYSFCQKAASAPDKDYFFIIDEINRGNMSKIFGELLMLIEKDYRGTPLTLAYDGRPFFVPRNLHIIGMMNTADRSLAMIDYALRRRFSFFDMEPGFDSDGFKSYQQDLNSEKLNRLVAELKSLNNAIVEDKSLGKGFCIGHSYLCGETICTDEWLQGVVEYDILPMLAEYWFDELDKYEEWKKRLTDAVK